MAISYWLAYVKLHEEHFTGEPRVDLPIIRAETRFILQESRSSEVNSGYTNFWPREADQGP